LGSSPKPKRDEEIHFEFHLENGSVMSAHTIAFEAGKWELAECRFLRESDMLEGEDCA